MYRPNFCCECGNKILRLHWHPWTSSQFCDACTSVKRKERLKRPALAASVLLLLGLITGRAIRPAPPPLIIQRSSNSLTTSSSLPGEAPAGSTAAVLEEETYRCGARTKKGTPCSRRVQGSVRCWQHRGLPAMLPPEKLIVK